MKSHAEQRTTGQTRRFFLRTATTAAALSVLPASPHAAAGSEEEVLYLSDLSQCEPKAALSEKPERHRWRMLPYETNEFAGTMLVAGRNTHAPEIRLPLRHKGWYAISVGVYSYHGEDELSRFQVRLSNDPVFTMLRHHEWEEGRIDDYFCRRAELSGDESIVFRQYVRQLVPDDPDSIANPCAGAWLAYVKLVALSPKEVETHIQETRSAKHRRLFAHHDAWSYTYRYRPTTADEIRREIAPFRDNDFERLYWEAGMGDRMYYWSKLRSITAADEWIDDPYRVGDRLAQETWQIWRRQGIDPLRVAANYAHEIGLSFHATYRPSGFHFPVPQDEWNTGGAYDNHPQWRGRDRQGRPTPRLSYAFEGVRGLVLGFLREMATYPIDGICLAYNRRPPYLEYESPLIEGFQQKYGEDPRELDPKDMCWLRYRATFMTDFMRAVRDAMNQAAPEQGRSKRLEVSAIVLSSEEENLYYGLDLEAWVNEGLVDVLAPYSSVWGIDSSKDSWVAPRDADFFYRITEGTSTKLALNLMPRRLSADEYRRRAYRLYKAGSEHFFFWDCNARNDFSPSWSVLRRLGHREELEAWARAGMPPYEAPSSRLRRLGDWDLTYETPG